MEEFINPQSPDGLRGIETMGKKVLIATLYNPDPVMLAVTRLGPDRLILLIDKEPDKEQNNAVKLIQDSLGNVLDVKVIKTEMYDVVSIATRVVDIIDSQPKEDIVYMNITGGRKTKAIAVLLAAYARHDKVKKIAYNPEEDKNSVVYLPRLSFKLTESQKMILEAVDNNKFATTAELATKVNMSTAMAYRAVSELEDMDMISTAEGIQLTDAGKIARL